MYDLVYWIDSVDSVVDGRRTGIRHPAGEEGCSRSGRLCSSGRMANTAGSCCCCPLDRVESDPGTEVEHGGGFQQASDMGYTARRCYCTKVLHMDWEVQVFCANKSAYIPC